MDRSSAGWRVTAIPCPSCYARLVRPDRWSTTRSVARYHCVRCGNSWELKSRERIREQRILLLGALAIACFMLLAQAPSAAAESICLGVITDGSPICTDTPTFAEWIASGRADQILMLVAGCAMFFIPLLVGLAVSCRIWCGIVSAAIFIGMVAGTVIGPMIVQYRYPGLYWSNPDQLGDMVHGALVAITLSVPMSTLVPRYFFGQPRAATTKPGRPNG